MKIFKKLIKYYLYISSNKVQKKYIKEIIKKNNLKTNIDSRNFIKKWKQLSKDVDDIYFKCFSNYTGDNINILSGNICVNYFEPLLNPIMYREYYEDKNIYNKFYKKNILPKTYLRRMNSIFMDENYQILKNPEEYFFNYIKLGLNKFIIKLSVDSSSGRSISLFVNKDGVLMDQLNNEFNWKKLLNRYGDNFIIQECLEQSDFLSKFNPTSVNTIRLVVYRSVIDNEPYVTNGILRIGSKNSVIDNAHSGGRFVGIDKNGKLNNYLCDTYGSKITKFNGIDFENNDFYIPNYAHIKEFAKEIVNEIPHHRLIALDIALDINDNPILIEYNIGGFGYWPFQFSGQITLDGFTDEIISYCLNNKNNNKISLMI